MSNAAENKTSELEARLRAVELENAERRPVADLLKYSGLLLALLLFVAGFFGYNRIQDIEEQIKSDLSDKTRDLVETEVRELLDDKEDRYERFISYLSSLEAREAQIETLFQKYASRIEELEKFQIKLVGADVEGEIERMIYEIRHRLSVPIDMTKPDPFVGTYLDEIWRLGLLTRMKEIARQKGIIAKLPSDKAHNLLQSLRSIGADRIIGEIFEKIPLENSRPSLLALRLSHTIRMEYGEKREEAFVKLMELVRNVDVVNPEIIIAEAWNAAEEAGRHASLISSLLDADRRLSEEDARISYVVAIAAQAHLRRGLNGDVERSTALIREAEAIAEKEPSYNRWKNHTLRTILEVRQRLGENRD